MLHKSFKPAKCKTSLKLAVSRIKLLRNKKDVHVRQLKAELAKLLEAGQEQTARIRVEHFVREEKSKEAYELVEIFCELIVARMPMIESQKHCPIDLKEAVSSVIFASPRCADIPELIDVSKHFKAKYGKEFVSAAVELRPQCGVNRMLVEKLSAKAPDGQSKIKILTAIAEEHNIKWDPKSFGDNINPPDDLLNGPNTFSKASHIQMESIGPQPSLDNNNKGSPSIRVPFKSDEIHRIPENSPEHNLRSKHHSQQSNFVDVNANQSNITGHHNSETRSSEDNAGGMHRHTNSGDQNNFSSGRQHWNMDFKDATSAARAAAESAELASLAARAAAELCSRGNISQPSSSEFQKSSSYSLRAGGPQGYASSNLQDQQLPKDQVDSAPRRSSMADDNRRDNDDTRNISQPSSSEFQKSSSYNLRAERPHPQGYASLNLQDQQLPKDQAASAPRRSSLTNDNRRDSDTRNISQPSSSEFHKSSSYNLRAEGPQPQGTSLNLQDQQLPKDQVVSAPGRSSLMYDNQRDNDSTRYMGDDAKNFSYPSSIPSNIDGNTSVTNFNAADRYSFKNSSESDSLDSVDKQPRNGMGFERTSSYGDVRIENDSNKVPSHEKLGNDTYDNPFAMDKSHDNESVVDTSFNDHASVVFDDYGLDDDYVPDYNYQRRESILEFSSPKETLPVNSSATDDTWIFKQNKKDSPEKSVSHSPISDRTSLFAGNVGNFDDHSDDLKPATFDHSDGPSSESEEESEEAEIIGKEDSSKFSKKQNLYSEKPKWTQNITHGLVGSLDEENRSSPSRRLSSELPLVHESKVEEKEKDNPRSSPDTIQDTLVLEEATSESYSGLGFGKLKGGLRNQKIDTRRPYANNSSKSDLPSKQAYENDASKTEQSTSISSSTARTSFQSNASSEETYDRSVEKPGEAKGSRAKHKSFTSNLDDSKDKFSDCTLRSDQESFSNRVVNEVSKKPAPTRVAVKYPRFHNDSDSEEDSPGHFVKNSPSRVAGLSRRTKSSTKTPNPCLEESYGTTPMSHEDVTERKASKSYYASTSPLKAKTGTRYSDRLESPEQPQSSKPFKQTPETKRSYDEERLKSYAKEQQSNYPREFDRQGNSESSKFSSSRDSTAASVKTRAQSSNSEQPQSTKASKPIPESKRSSHEERLTPPTKELPSNPSSQLETQGNSESTKKEKTKAVEKASHVHPKLPDYDNFAAHFLSLRQNNK